MDFKRACLAFNSLICELLQGRLPLSKATLNFCLKGSNSTGSIAIKIIVMQLIDFSESRYDLKVSEFC
jgi:hypothetical protein